jgi:hypothetical protein
MDRIEFHGTFNTDDAEVMVGVFKAWLRADSVHSRMRLSGPEIVYEADGLEFLCQDGMTGRGESALFLLQGHLDTTPAAADEKLRLLARICRERHVDFQLEYVAVDEQGQVIGDEISLA